MNELILIIGGVIIGILGVIVGGSMFFSIPLIQILFPQIPFGAVVGNIKTGSFFRGLGSTLSTLRHIDWKKNVIISIPLFLGTIFGVSVISDLGQEWVLPAIILAVVIAEIAPKVAHKINKKSFLAAAITTGGYAGILGAGIGVFLIALLRTQFPKDSDIAHVKIQARAIEWLIVIVAVATHILHGNLELEIWLPWSIGSIVGGFAGGMLLKKIGKLSGNIQKTILRISFAVAIGIALINTIS